MSTLVADEARFAWTAIIIGVIALVLMVDRSVERKVPGGVAAFSPKAFVELLWAWVVGALVAPLLLPLVLGHHRVPDAALGCRRAAQSRATCVPRGNLGPRPRPND